MSRFNESEFQKFQKALEKARKNAPKPEEEGYRGKDNPKAHKHELTSRPVKLAPIEVDVAEEWSDTGSVLVREAAWRKLFPGKKSRRMRRYEWVQLGEGEQPVPVYNRAQRRRDGFHLTDKAWRDA